MIDDRWTNVPIVLPDHWDDDKKNEERQERNPLPMQIIRRRSGAGLAKVIDATQVTGGNVGK